MAKDILGGQLIVGDIILFHHPKRGRMVPARILEMPKGSRLEIEIGYFLKSGELYFYKEPELYFTYSNTSVRVDRFKVHLAM